jgi:hypothetical protein
MRGIEQDIKGLQWNQSNVVVHIGSIRKSFWSSECLSPSGKKIQISTDTKHIYTVGLTVSECNGFSHYVNTASRQQQPCKDEM